MISFTSLPLGNWVHCQTALKSTLLFLKSINVCLCPLHVTALQTFKDYNQIYFFLFPNLFQIPTYLWPTSEPFQFTDIFFKLDTVLHISSTAVCGTIVCHGLDMFTLLMQPNTSLTFLFFSCKLIILLTYVQLVINCNPEILFMCTTC